MRKARVIIGANYGDEGKGLMTDYFASQDPEGSLVVRFNGGAQAGHTVVCPDGRRHIFSHFGSGSFHKCPSFLSKFFIVNPMLFAKELRILKELALTPVVYTDPEAIVSTPFDIFINQEAEIRRGGKRHGSCGIGINETVTRCLRKPEYLTRVKDLFFPERLEKQLLLLQKNWFPQRIKELGIEQDSESVQAFLSKKDAIIEHYLDDLAVFLSEAVVTKKCPQKKQIIFEGAQGLMLDEERHDQFPHVTRSRTGLTNVLALLEQFEIESLDITYMSRTYLTRHGAGPLKDEDSFRFPDATNVPNQFQGTLRFARLNMDDLKYSIEKDLMQAENIRIKLNASLALTCADQYQLPQKSQLPLPVSYISFGPTREDIKELSLARASV